MEWRRTEKIKYRIVEYKKFGILYIRGINETKFDGGNKDEIIDSES